MDLENAPFIDLIEDEIKEVDDRMLSRSYGHHPELEAALRHLLSSGGKRVRPMIAILTGSLLGADKEKLITLGASIELLHTATLVHDDLIDGALLRRGNPTLNSDWSPAATVLTGDYIFAQAAELAAEIGSTDVMTLFAKTLTTIVNGEVRQLFNRKGVTTRDEYFRRIYEKTGSMFVLATHAAALLSFAQDEVIIAAKTYGHEVGKAFQIVDDILDFTGDETRLGKPVGGDLQQGVLTLPMLYFKEKHPEHEGLKAVMDGKGDPQLLDGVISDIRASDAVPSAMEDARLFAQNAVDSLSTFPPGEEREALRDLAEFVIEREI